MKQENIQELFKNAEQLHRPTYEEPEKSCNNCEDYIVCYGLDEADNPEKGKNCPDWQLDILTYQELIQQRKKK